MTAKTAQQIYNEIKAHIQKENSPTNLWYVGITSDVDSRLFGDHNVPRSGHWYIFREALSNTDARNVESELINKFGTDGGPGGGDASSVYVYAYKKTPLTNP